VHAGGDDARDGHVSKVYGPLPTALGRRQDARHSRRLLIGRDRHGDQPNQQMINAAD
jgi:hypothetical protein